LTAADAARALLARTCFVQWPFLSEARVVSVEDASHMFSVAGTLPPVSSLTPHSTPTIPLPATRDASAQQKFIRDMQVLAAGTMGRCGLDIGTIRVLLTVQLCGGAVRTAAGGRVKKFNEDTIQVPLQACHPSTA
jgi:hypothetical protein